MVAHRRSLDGSWELVLVEDVSKQTQLELELGATQAEVVNDFIETTCWGEVLPHLLGKQGTPKQRLADLRLAFKNQK